MEKFHVMNSMIGLRPPIAAPTPRPAKPAQEVMVTEQLQQTRARAARRTHFSDGRVDHALQAILLRQSLCDFVSAVVQSDLLACDARPRAGERSSRANGTQRASCARHANSRTSVPSITTDLSRAISSSMPVLMASRTVICKRAKRGGFAQQLGGGLPRTGRAVHADVVP